MKSKYAAVLSIITLLNFSNIEAAFSEQTVNQNQPRNIVTQVAAKTGTTGSFRAGEHPTQGNVRIITERGKHYLEFDKSFKTDNGPDLFVVLYRNQTVPVSGIKEKDYKSIARLQKTQGTQRYAIPDNVNLADFKAVAVWCRQFNATFGYAPLPQTTTAPKVATNITKSGNFQAGEHPTEGMVKLVTENGKRYLEFDKNFKTDKGPDLFVILHKNATLPNSGIKEKDYVSIARLQATNGNQRYAIPNNVNLADFRSVAIWCRQFNATFGFATLNS